MQKNLANMQTVKHQSSCTWYYFYTLQNTKAYTLPWVAPNIPLISYLKVALKNLLIINFSLHGILVLNNLN